MAGSRWRVLMKSNRDQVLFSGASRGSRGRSYDYRSQSTAQYELPTKKEAWILHMLRKKVGDEAFQQGVRTYYDRYKLSNALSKDFQAVMEEVSGQELEGFFQQWLYQPAFPVIGVDWSYDEKKKQLEITLSQNQKGTPFDAEVELGIQVGGEMQLETMHLSGKEASASFKVKSRPSEIVLDPNLWLLFQEK